MPKKIPMRQCLGCREMKQKRDLIRAVRSPQGEVSLDFVGKKPGRGAYLCPDEQCLKKAIKSKALSRAFGVDIPDSVMEELSNQSKEMQVEAKES
ncbi:MAG: YlxR family protein [Oscillospiraceae bacterium]|nr:YlxR family protein [Oscillospiraceae bacterium]